MAGVTFQKKKDAIIRAFAGGTQAQGDWRTSISIQEQLVLIEAETNQDLVFVEFWFLS